DISNGQANISRAQISNIQTLDFGGGFITMTADQLNEFSLLNASTGFSGATIFAANGGTYSLQGKNILGHVDLSADGLTDNVTLIGNDQTGQILIGGDGPAT